MIEVLFQSAEKRAPVRLAEPRPGSPPSPDQVIERPGVQEPELVKATPPSGKS